ncbi:MAG: oligosaccharide flippase family protein [Bacteroidales bacterium]|jgi:O-antigen/teichoic acid export membrane protein|nr:oligosaccharide flippase family protein [Bacteroidales bacterium]
MTNSLKKLVRQTAIYGTSSIIGKLLNYFLVPFHTRIFSTEQYGIVSEYYAYIPVILVLLTCGLETGFFRFSKDKENFDTTYSSIFTTVFTFSFIFLIIIFLTIGPLSNLLGYSKHHEYTLLVAFIIFLDAVISIPFAKLRIQNKASKFAIYKILNICFNIGFNIIFFALCPYLLEKNITFVSNFYKPEIGIGYIFISNLLGNIITFLMLIPEIIKVKYNFDIQIMKKILKYSLPLLIVGLAGMINETMDRIFIKNILSTSYNIKFAQEQVGIYSANYKLAILMTMFIQMFRYAAEPFFFENTNEKDSKKLYAQVTKYFIIFGLGIFLFVLLYIDIFKYFVGVDFRKGLNIVPILLLANLFLGIFFNLSMWYKLNDMTKYGAIITLIGAVITIILNILLIPKIGYMGSAWTTLICYLTMTIISYTLGQKYYKIPYNLKNAGFYFIISGVIFVLSYYLVSLINNFYLRNSINTILLLIYILIFIKKEKAIPQITSLKNSILKKLR